jgi:tetratricopeptide (TPR) repeat protein
MREVDHGTGAAKMFFSLSDYERTQVGGLFRGRQLHFLAFHDPSFTNEGEDIDISNHVPAPWSVSVMALEIALFMGFSEIYLLGCDHDWILHVGESRHFYQEEAHALVRAGLNEWADVPEEGYLEGQCQHLINLWQQYKALKRIARGRGIQIINATQGGLLDVFPRVTLESLFNERSSAADARKCGEDLLTKGDFSLAKAELLRVVRLNPKDARAHALLASALAALKQDVEARSAARAALAIDIANADAIDVLFQVDDFENARDALVRSVAFSPIEEPGATRA